MAKNAIAFVAGLGGGFLDADRREKDRARQAKLDQITFDQADRASEQYAEAKKTKANLAAAYQPAVVSDKAATLDISGKPVLYENADVAQSDFRQARTMAENGTPEAAPPVINAPKPSYAAAGLPFADKASAQAGADSYNRPEAQTQRVIAALGGADPLKALDLDNQQALRGRETTKFNQDQEKRTKELAEEGVFDGLKALSNGDAAGMKAAFNGSGKYKIEGEPVLTPVKKTVPGLGQIDSYDATFTVVGPDGKTTTQTVNSFDTRLKLMPFEKQFEAGLKAREVDSKGELRVAQAENMALRAGIAASRASGGGGGRGAGRGGPADDQPAEFNPLGNFDAKKAQAVAFEQASKMAEARAAEGKPMTAAEQGAVAQQTYRSMEDSFANENSRRQRTMVFKRAATNAKTPEEIEQVKARAAQSGFTTEEMASLDKRFMPATKPSASKPNAAASTPAAQPVKPVQAAEIPAPPPETRQVGLSTVKNPQYVQWQAQYGEAYQAEKAKRAAAADAAKASFNPYAQNKVR